MSSFQDMDNQGSGGGNGGGNGGGYIDDADEITQMIAAEFAEREDDLRSICSTEGRAKIDDPDQVRAPDQVIRECLLGDPEIPLSPQNMPDGPDDPDMERALEESRLLYEVEGNTRQENGEDLEFERAIEASIQEQIRHEEEVSQRALEEEKSRRVSECDLILRRIRVMFQGKSEILAKVDAIFRKYMECPDGRLTIDLPPDEHAFFCDLMDYLYLLPHKLLGRSVITKELFERLTRHLVIHDPDISAEEQFFLRTHWIDGLKESDVTERYVTLKSIFL